MLAPPNPHVPHSISRPFLFSMVGIMILSWAFNFIVGKVALRHFDAVTLASFRVILATLILVPIFLATGPHKTISRADHWPFAQLGFLGVAMNQCLFIIGLSLTSVGHSSLIMATGPISVLLLSRQMGLERLTTRKIVGMALSFTGVAVLVAERGLTLRGGTWYGDLITMSGSFSFALYAVFGKRVAGRYDSVAMNMFNFLAAAILISPLALRQALVLDWASVGWAGWAALFYMSAFASVMAYLIYYLALRHLAASQLAAFSYLLPVLATVLGILLLGEHVTSHLLAGGSLVLAGVYLTESKAGHEPESEAVLPVE